MKQINNINDYYNYNQNNIYDNNNDNIMLINKCSNNNNIGQNFNNYNNINQNGTNHNNNDLPINDFSMMIKGNKINIQNNIDVVAIVLYQLIILAM